MHGGKHDNTSKDDKAMYMYRYVKTYINIYKCQGPGLAPPHAYPFPWAAMGRMPPLSPPVGWGGAVGWEGAPRPVGGGGRWVGVRGIHRRRSTKNMHLCMHVCMRVCMHTC